METTEVPKLLSSESSRNGYHIVLLENLKHFRDVFEAHADTLGSGDYLFRGQRNAQWRVESSLSRRLRDVESEKKRDISLRHLDNILVQTMIDGKISEETSRRAREWIRKGGTLVDDINPDSTGYSAGGIQDVVDVWSIAQHHSAPTPLIDWSISPFTAAFFAFDSPLGHQDNVRCAIYALNRVLVSELSREQINMQSEGMGGFYFVNACAKYNPRIIAQRGLFSFSRSDLPVEQWITRAASKDTKLRWEKLPVLIKFILPGGYSATNSSLEFLEAYGINVGRVYPDFDGRMRHATAVLDKNIVSE